MATVQIRQLINPTKEELDEAGEVLAAAFREDHFIDQCIGGDQTLNLPLQRATVAAAALGGEIWVATHENQGMVGVAAWFAPGRLLLDTPDQGEAGFNELMGKFRPDVMKWWGEYFLPKYNAATTSILGEGTKIACWHLQEFGVLPEYQNKGIGRKLMEPVESKAQASGVAICLEAETEKNVAIYKHWGYTVKGEEQFEGLTLPISMWVLYKEPEVSS